MKSDLNVVDANFRGREPSILGLNDHHVGNYEANVPYFSEDVETSALIRQSIRDTDGEFRALRSCPPQTEIPKLFTLLRDRISLITNWATFYSDLRLQGDESGNVAYQYKTKLHLPIMGTDGIITSVWNIGIIFRPRAGELEVFMITRCLDSEALIQLKVQNGVKFPMG